MGMRILSGIQPTGRYHIGNYLGAIKHWVRLQEQHEALFFIADLHAITVPQDPFALRQATFEKAVELLSLGINPERATLFVQSHVPEVTELAWIFNTITPLGELERMTQFKDKAKKKKENENMGLLDYPVLQAADVLIYKSQGVPVGKDQEQHLELTRAIARRFNTKFGETFPIPEALIPEQGAKILSLEDPSKKMSKSDPEDSQLGLTEDPSSIRRKIMKAVTDKGKQVSYNPTKKPGISNLLLIYSLFQGKPMKEVERKFKNKGYATFKKALADLLVEKLDPFRRKKKEIESRQVYVKEILRQGANHARTLAQSTMEEVREKIGLLSL